MTMMQRMKLKVSEVLILMRNFTANHSMPNLCRFLEEMVCFKSVLKVKSLTDCINSMPLHLCNLIFLIVLEVTLEYFQKNGFLKPILIMDKTGLGMRVPSQNFTVADVKQCVGM